MTSHAVADEKYTKEFATIRDAYRVGEGNVTIRGECERQVSGAARRGGGVSRSRQGRADLSGDWPCMRVRGVDFGGRRFVVWSVLLYSTKMKLTGR